MLAEFDPLKFATTLEAYARDLLVGGFGIVVLFLLLVALAKGHPIIRILLLCVTVIIAAAVAFNWDAIANGTGHAGLQWGS